MKKIVIITVEPSDYITSRTSNSVVTLFDVGDVKVESYRLYDLPPNTVVHLVHHTQIKISYQDFIPSARTTKKVCIDLLGNQRHALLTEVQVID